MASKLFSRFTKGTRSSYKDKTPSGLNLPPAPVIEQTPRVTVPAVTVEEPPVTTANQTADTDVREQLAPPTKKIVSNQELSEPHTESKPSGGAYELFWREEQHDTFRNCRHPRINTYAPNALAMFEILEIAENKLAVNRHIQTQEPNYVPYAVKVYYAFIFYKQILRARKAAGKLTTDETTVLSRLDKYLPDQSLVICEPLYPYFNTIIATEFEDPMFDWNIPVICDEMFTTGAAGHEANSFSGFVTHQGSVFFQPQLPAMMALLSEFIHCDDIAACMNRRVFTPYAQSAAANNTCFDVTYRNNNATGAAFKPIFASSGFSSPFKFGNDNYVDAQYYARESDYASEVNISVTGLNGQGPSSQEGNAIPASRDYRSLERFLFSERSSNRSMRWFNYLKEMAITHARFFDAIYNLNDVATVGGLETTVICRLRIDTDTQADLFTNNIQYGINANAVTWYPRVLRSLVAGFATNMAGVRTNEELQAKTFGTNATLPSRTDAHTAPFGSTYRTGPIWENQQWKKELFYRDYPQGKMMFTQFTSVLGRMYRSKPHGTGIVDELYM